MSETNQQSHTPSPQTSLKPVRSLGRKQAEVQGRLTALIQQLGPRVKLPTTTELREMLGISVVTLNSALKALETQELITRRPGIGVFTSERVGQRRIALLCNAFYFCDSGVSPFWSILLERLQERASLENERAEIFLCTQDEFTRQQILSPSLMDDLRTGLFEGVLTIGITKEPMEWLDSLAVPCVGFAGPGKDSVRLRDEGVIRLGIQALVEQGCRRIAYWQRSHHITLPPSPSFFQPNPASQIVARVLQQHGLTFDPRLFQDNRHLLVPPEYRVPFGHQEQGYRLAEMTFGKDSSIPPPDGIVSGDDMMTLGILAYLRQHDIPVGEHLRIASHANKGSNVLLGWEDELTLIEFDPAELVDALFTRLHLRMTGDYSVSPVNVVYIEPQLKVSSSTHTLSERNLLQ